MEKIMGHLPLFVEAARQMSFTRAADVLGVPLSTVSRRIQALEKALGVPLFYRNTRKMELTEHGKFFFEQSTDIVADVEAAREALSQHMQTPAGRVRLAIPGDIYHGYMLGALGRFAVKWPSIQLHVHFSSLWVDPHTDPFDLNIRTGPLPDSDLLSHRLITLTPALYAAPTLFADCPEPRTPADLTRIPCISLVRQGMVWTVGCGKKTESITIQPAHMVNDVSLSLELALAGAGATWLTPVLAREYENTGKLVRLLPDWTYPGADINLVMASRTLPRRVRLVADYIVDYFAGLPQ